MAELADVSMQRAYDARIDLEREISRLLKEFTKETYLEVTHVSIDGIHQFDGLKPIGYKVSVEARL